MVLGRQMWWSTTDTLVILPPFILLATPTTHTHMHECAFFVEVFAPPSCDSGKHSPTLSRDNCLSNLTILVPIPLPLFT